MRWRGVGWRGAGRGGEGRGGEMKTLGGAHAGRHHNGLLTTGVGSGGVGWRVEGVGWGRVKAEDKETWDRRLVEIGNGGKNTGKHLKCQHHGVGWDKIGWDGVGCGVVKAEDKERWG